MLGSRGFLTTVVRPRRGFAAIMVGFGAAALQSSGGAAAQQHYDDPNLVCAMAAGRAERDWALPQGLLAAIGLVESGRRSPAGAFPVIWPWTINAEGQGYYAPSKAAAMGMVRTLQLRGVRVIDVGCFQVDLFYHPYVFTGLDDAFDPEANARAAARILSLGRFGSTGWDGAVAAYHSANPLIGWGYMQKVRAVWPWARAHPPLSEETYAAFAVLLSPQARLVRVVSPFDPVAASADGGAQPDQSPGRIQWLHPPQNGLPRVVTPFSPGLGSRN